jgi:hypothetical protein
MECGIPKNLPCAVCGLVTFRHAGWYLLMENRWLDHLKVLTWHASLAGKQEVRSACCREHLKVIVAYWLEEASLPQASPKLHLSIPLPGSGKDHADPEPQATGRLIGELSVHRESWSRSWAGSPATLECILDVLIPETTENKRSAREYRTSNMQPEAAGLMLH